ncbi:MAG: peptidoglycan DD-metalloendopeptidase family protein [Pseudomonadota bacterium]
MTLTLITHTRGGAKRLQLGRAGQICAALAGVGLLSAACFGGYLVAVKLHPNGVVSQRTVENWQQELDAQRQAVETARAESEQQINALAARVARLQAHIARLDAVGERVTELVGLEGKEFEFSAEPALGGPEGEPIGTAPGASPLEFIGQLDAMHSQLETRGRQLAVLESLLLDKHMGTEKLISGHPVSTGYISSYFGYRTDPFHGSTTWHKGIDFVAPEGSDVLATAAGVVTFSGVKDGYGNLVEISHGDGLVTRYGHNSKLNVKVGELVRKGQVIAKVGSTGRSTAPHVHYEVARDGLFLNPAKYLGKKG